MRALHLWCATSHLRKIRSKLFLARGIHRLTRGFYQLSLTLATWVKPYPSADPSTVLCFDIYGILQRCTHMNAWSMKRRTIVTVYVFGVYCTSLQRDYNPYGEYAQF